MHRIVSTIVAAGLLFGCSGEDGDGSPTGPSARRGGTLVIDSPQLGQLRGFDPIRVTDINTSCSTPPT